jgi:hypothetical protein
MTIYRAMYPFPGTPDGFEFESLGMWLAQRYGYNLSENWQDQITLGQVFEHARRA